MSYNKYEIMEAKINKNLEGDQNVLKKIGTKKPKMPEWFKEWTENVYQNQPPRWFKEWTANVFEPKIQRIIKLNNLKD